MRLLILFTLLAAACSKPCALVCQDNSDCPSNSNCFEHVACLSQCSNLVCAGNCVDSFHNCGACGTACAQGQVCNVSPSGVAACAAACDSGLTSCSGSCYSLQNDRLNCGGCGHRCANNEYCSSGKCTAACE